MIEQPFLKNSLRPRLTAVAGLLGLAALALVAGAGLATAYWLPQSPEVVTQVVDRRVEVPVEVVRHVPRPCLLSSAVAAPAATKGWLQYRDVVSCFTIEYPQGWQVSAYDSEVYVHDPNTSLTVRIVRPVLNADSGFVRSKEQYDGWLADGGMKEFRLGLIGETAWSMYEGSRPNSNGMGKMYLAVTGYGAFEMRLTRQASEDGAVLERIAQTFQTQ